MVIQPTTGVPRTPPQRWRALIPRPVRIMGIRAREIVRPERMMRELRVGSRPDGEAEAEEERVDEREADAHGAGHDVARRELEAAAEHDEALMMSAQF